MKDRQIEVLNVIAQTIYDKKGTNIYALDVQEITSLTDYFLIAEGSVDRHVQALSHAIIEKLKEIDYPIFRVEGKNSGGWVVIDCGQLLIHLFRPDLRGKYALEELWHDGKIVDLDIRTGEEAG